MFEEKLAKQIVGGFADRRLNTAHLAWLIKMDAYGPIEGAIDEFFYFYILMRHRDTPLPNVTMSGSRLVIELHAPPDA